MDNKAKLLIGVCALTLLGAVVREAAAQGVTVTPANPVISVGGTQPFSVTEVSPATDVVAGDYHACAVLQNGEARCWGNNSLGQLGNGTITDSSVPVAVLQLTQAAAVTTGGFHSCAVLRTGAVQCWGTNELGQLGDGTTTHSAVPVTVSGISNAIAVAAGYHHTCALLLDGTVRCWGDDSYGQLGVGNQNLSSVRGGPSTAHSSVPVTVIGISTAVGVMASDGYHSCAVLQDGTVRCWGDNVAGQLGDGSRNGSSVPVTVAGVTTATAVSGGDFHSCALRQDRTINCWGLNYSGQLGDGTNNDSNTAVQVSGINTAVGVSVGVIHTCAVLQDGGVRCWGFNSSGQLGDGTTSDSSFPRTASGITNAIGITAGNNDSCAVLPGGVVRCWGMNTYGEIGNGTTIDVYTPVAVVGISPTWTSGNATVATIDPSGFATGRGPGATTITANFQGNSGSTSLTVSGQPALTVVKNGTGQGTVTSSPLGIDCGTTCQASFDTGTQVTLTATPVAGSTFDGWSGCEAVNGNTCTVTMNSIRSVTATFTRIRYTVTVNKDGIGSGTVTSNPSGINCGSTCAAAYDSGTVVTLTAVPAMASVFVGWSGCDATSGADCTVTMNAAKSVTATFVGVPWP